jgi:hypothetical protein
MEHTGRFKPSPTGGKWKPFTPHQRVIVRRPGCLWDARIAMAPGVAVRVQDAYAGGKGLLHAAVLGLFEMADMTPWEGTWSNHQRVKCMAVPTAGEVARLPESSTTYWRGTVTSLRLEWCR